MKLKPWPLPKSMEGELLVENWKPVICPRCQKGHLVIQQGPRSRYFKCETGCGYTVQDRRKF